MDFDVIGDGRHGDFHGDVSLQETSSNLNAIEVYPHGDPWCFVSLNNPMNCPLMVEPPCEFVCPKNLSAPLTGNRIARK